MDYKIGDSVTVTGKPYYTSYGGKPGKELTNYSGKITHINDKSGVPYPIHVDQKGWFALANIVSDESSEDATDNFKDAYDKWNYNIGAAQKKARNVSIVCVFQGNDITSDMEKYLVSFSYTDNEEGIADDISLTLDDRDEQWTKWISSDTDFNIKGAEIGVSIVKHNYHNDGKDEIFECGTFEVDTVDVKGPPRQLTFKASAINSESKLKNEPKTQAWETVTLEEIAVEIASRADYACKYYSAVTAYYERLEQVKESDIAFLSRMCKKVGISLKVSNKAIILFDQSKFEKEEAVMTVTPDCGLITYDLKETANDAEYNKCTVKYTNPKTKKTISGSYELKNIEDGKSFTVTDEKVSSKAEAQSLAKKKLREKNREGNSVSFTLAGDFSLVAGVNINVEGFYGFDGKYMVKTATHNVTGGYNTTILARKVLEDC